MLTGQGITLCDCCGRVLKKDDKVWIPEPDNQDEAVITNMLRKEGALICEDCTEGFRQEMKARIRTMKQNGIWDKLLYWEKMEPHWQVLASVCEECQAPLVESREDPELMKCPVCGREFYIEF